MRLRKWLLILVLPLAALLALLFLAFREPVLTVTRYELETDKLTGTLKLALLSDLHNGVFGEENGELVEKVREYGPDLILIAGDMVNKNDPDVSVAVELCEDLVEIAPVWYMYGNHEGSLQYGSGGPPLDRYLTSRGVQVLTGGTYEFSLGTDSVKLLGWSVDADKYRDDPAFRDAVDAFMEQDGYKIVMSHYPDLLWDALADKPFDLGLAGHYHGGMVVLPGIGGLYQSDEGLFPEHWGGSYPLEYGTLIISRGLGTGSRIPRINNEPELVLIDIFTTNP